MGQIFGVSVPIPQSLLDVLIQKIEEKLRPILGPIRAIVAIFTKFRETVPGMLTKMQNLASSALEEYRGFTTFSFKSSPRTRVIQSVRAYQELSDLITKVPTEIFTKLKDLASILRSRLNIQETFSPEDIEGLEDLRGLIKKFGGKFTLAFEKLLGVLAIILDTIDALNRTLDDLQTIVDDIKHVRTSLQNLQGFVLPQNNKRIKVELADGSTMYRRQGHLLK